MTLLSRFSNLVVGVVLLAVLGTVLSAEAVTTFTSWNTNSQCAAAILILMGSLVAGWFAFEQKRVC